MRSCTIHLAAVAALLTVPVTASAADLPFGMVDPPVVAGSVVGDGYRVPRRPVRPPPLHFDAYGYPVPGPFVADGPSPLAISSGCTAGLQPIYDAAGNFAGYAPVPLCR